MRSHASLDDEMQKQFNRNVSTFMINNLMAKIHKDELSFEEFRKYYPDELNVSISEICYLKTLDLINSTQAKEIFEAVWKNPYIEVCDYICQSKLLEGVDDLDEHIDKIIADNEKIVQQILGGKDKAVGSLIGQLMKVTKGKADPQAAGEKFMAKVLTIGKTDV
jgi:aspartyl-tRNA(Asn)/glutamyl-tRNA(Gln) amidotransferase subunit B